MLVVEDVVDTVLVVVVNVVVVVVVVAAVVVALVVAHSGRPHDASRSPCDQFSDAKNFFPFFERRMHLPSGFTSQYTQPCAVAHLRAQSFGCHVVLSGAVAGSSSSSRLPLK